MTIPSETERLEQLAEQIPSMGGLKIGDFLRGAARDDAIPGTAIVELGSWLGSGTAQLALGLRDRKDDHGIAIHCFDRWEADESEVAKASAAGLDIAVGQDTLPVVKDLLAPFDVPISYHQGWIQEQTWDGTPISVFVVDACKTSKPFFAALKTFGASWIPGTTVIFLMDYYYWRKSGKDDHRCQIELIEGNPANFSEPVRVRDVGVMLRYLAPLDFSRLLK